MVFLDKYYSENPLNCNSEKQSEETVEEMEKNEEWGGEAEWGREVEWGGEMEFGPKEEESSQDETVDICNDALFSEQEVEKKERKTQEGEMEAPDSEAEKSIPLVLEPDHPMMQRFQAALKTHLLKKLARLNDQVLELDNDIKAKEKEREEIGTELYAMQQEVYKQQNTLDDCEIAIESLMKERQTLDETVSSKKKSWKEEVNNLNLTKKKEIDMMTELQRLSTLQQQMEKWEKEMESELTVSQRISEKTQYDKNKMIEEKRKMDMYLLRLMTTITDSEAEIRLLDGEIDVKLEEKDLLSQTLTDANTDLQCLITEHKRLFSAWNSVVNTISQRNNIYNEINKELIKCQEGFQALNVEIQSYKRSSAEEMKKSEKLAIIHSRMETTFENQNLTLRHLIEKKDILQEKIVYMNAVISKNESEILRNKMAIEEQTLILDKIKKNSEKISEEKQEYEDLVLKVISERLIQDHNAMNLAKKLNEEREKCRKQEHSTLDLENKISQKFLEVEELKEIVARNNDILKEMSEEYNSMEGELKKYNDEISRCCKAIFQKQGNFATLLRKIEKFTESNSSLAPTQQQIMNLEKTNAEIQAKNDKLQNFWLIQQTNNVKLTNQRQNQLKDISLIRKQVLILEQKALKVNTEFEIEKKIENNINKSIQQLQHKLTVLNEIFVGKKDYQQALGKENTFTQAQYLQSLKDAELEQVRLKAEVKDLETNLEELAETMLSVQREMLAWERKIKSALEAKTDMQKERSGSSELGQMKAEIHRMEVRQSQLKKVQDKLINDLELCVLKRDAISEEAEGRESRPNRGFNTRHTIQKKIETLKNDIRAVCNEKKQLEKVIENTTEGHKELKKAILEKEAQLIEMKETSKKMDEQIEEGKLQKIQNLEMIIRRQKKCKLYELVKNGKHRLLFKNEGLIEREIQKVKYTNNDLIAVTEALIENFPDYRFPLRKIYNALRAKPS